MKWTPERIRALRHKLDETQEEFRHRLGVGLTTLQWWEQGHGKPNGSARILLDRIEADIAEGRTLVRTRSLPL